MPATPRSSSHCISDIFFFFQAEDGIRDLTVTGVQTCALPISRHPVEIEVAHAERAVGQTKYSLYRLIRLNFDLMTGFSVAPLQFFSMAGGEIGRASCRERV